MVVTNGTMTKRFDEIITWDKALLSHLFIKFSFHYLEMTRLNMLDIFIDNVKNCTFGLFLYGRGYSQ
mgnify:CR=1 FL=1